jgi:hypothetical protein
LGVDHYYGNSLERSKKRSRQQGRLNGSTTLLIRFKGCFVVIRILLKENNTYDHFTTQQVFIMMQERPIRPHRAIKPKIGVSAGGKATITSLPIITSQDYQYLFSDLRTWLVYLQKITEHSEPFMPALMKASTYITVHYRNGIHALSRCMDSVLFKTQTRRECPLE